MIFITKINDFKKINKKLLKLIKEIKPPLLIPKDEFISNTDWYLPKDHERKYLDYFYETINPYMGDLALKLHSKKCSIQNGWFQQYKKSAFHGWHTHPKCNFTNVYFVELPDKSLATEILGHGKFDLNEGDLFTFPSYLYHRSPINNLNKRKTIVSFNCDFFDYINK
jgi:hypothetical protein